MKKIIISVFILALSVFPSGCSTGDVQQPPDGTAGIEGYVTAVEGGRILVVSSEAQDFSSTGGVDEFYNAIWFSNAPDSIKAGDFVKVWFDAVAESYPGQSEAIHVEVVQGQKPEGASLSQSEALNKALRIHDQGVYAVLSISYNQETDKWNIRLKDVMVMDEKEYDIDIEDE